MNLSMYYIFEKGEEIDIENASNAEISEFSFYSNEKEILFFPFSCFEIMKIETNKEGDIEYSKIYLSYIGKYKTKINLNQKIILDFQKVCLVEEIC